jgi:hypothetical protein
MNLRIPDVVANAAAACGAGGWLRDLPGLIAELEAGDLGVGRRGAGDERAAVHPDQPAAAGSADA